MSFKEKSALGKGGVALIFSLIFLFLMAFPSHILSPSLRPYLIIWNVGQGQWVTHSDSLFCLHFDMGGEFASFQKIYKECRRKQNLLFLSHGDWDHIRFIRRVKGHLPSLCLVRSPKGVLNERKTRFLKLLPPCSLEDRRWSQSLVHELSFFPFEDFTKQGKRRKPFTSNDLSRVFVLNKRLLLPGDSTSRSEKIWLRGLISYRRSLKWILASHHGSRSSNSKVLLSFLSPGQSVLVSARKKKYGHPHALVLRRWKEKGLFVLRTEIWGNIYLQM